MEHRFNKQKITHNLIDSNLTEDSRRMTNFEKCLTLQTQKMIKKNKAVPLWCLHLCSAGSHLINLFTSKANLSLLFLDFQQLVVINFAKKENTKVEQHRYSLFGQNLGFDPPRSFSWFVKVSLGHTLPTRISLVSWTIESMTLVTFLHVTFITLIKNGDESTSSSAKMVHLHIFMSFYLWMCILSIHISMVQGLMCV